MSRSKYLSEFRDMVSREYINGQVLSAFLLISME